MQIKVSHRFRRSAAGINTDVPFLSLPYPALIDIHRIIPQYFGKTRFDSFYQVNPPNIKTIISWD